VPRHGIGQRADFGIVQVRILSALKINKGKIMQAFEKEFSRAARFYCKRGEAIMEMLPVAKEVDARGQFKT